MHSPYATVAVPPSSCQVRKLRTAVLSKWGYISILLYCMLVVGRFDVVCASALPPTMLVASTAATVSTSPTHVSNQAIEVELSESGEKNGNIILQLFGYVKDSFVRTVDGTKEMWTNYGRCNEIRSKQRLYRESLKQDWEMTRPGMSQKEMKQLLQREQGGITYDEFVFLRKGKEDRGKLMNMAFLMIGAPKYLPYAIMFYPDILPSPFAQTPSADDVTESQLEKKSRERAHAVVNTLIEIEKSAKTIPSLAKLNFFGRNKQRRQLTSMNKLGLNMARVMEDPNTYNGQGAQALLDLLDDQIFSDEEPSRAATRLVPTPKPVVLGLVNAIDGPQFASFILPNFMRRGKIVAHLQKVAEADDFLVKEKVDLQTLSTARLLDACNDRMIGSLGRSDEEMRACLADWLETAVIKPAERVERTGHYYNGNMARTALLAYHAVESTRDARSSSYLPRLLFQDQPKKVEETTQPEGPEPLAFFSRIKRKSH